MNLKPKKIIAVFFIFIFMLTFLCISFFNKVIAANEMKDGPYVPDILNIQEDKESQKSNITIGKEEK